MTILINKDTKVVVQGITGHQGSYHTEAMKAYGTKIVAGVTPGKGGQEVHGIPVLDTVREAKEEYGATASIIFVPAPFTMDATFEAIEAELSPIVVITEHVPVKDEIKMIHAAKQKGLTIIGPNTPGVISPEESKMGIMPGHIFKKGKVGVISRSGTLTYEIASGLTNAGFGQSTAVGIGGDPVTGTNFIDILEMFKQDKETKAVVLIGEIGGNAEEQAAEYIKKEFDKPVVAFIAGKTAPPGKRMGHAGAIISGTAGTAKSKIAALEKAGVRVADKPRDIAEIMRELI